MREVELLTAQSHLADEAKIQSLVDLVEADDYEKLAFVNREQARQYTNKTVGLDIENPNNGDDVNKGSKRKGHILGDVHNHIEQPNKNPIASLMLPLAAMGLMGALAWKLLDSQAGPSNPNIDANTTYQVEKWTPDE